MEECRAIWTDKANSNWLVECATDWIVADVGACKIDATLGKGKAMGTHMVISSINPMNNMVDCRLGQEKEMGWREITPGASEPADRSGHSLIHLLYDLRW
jgi:hypothetical protein